MMLRKKVGEHVIPSGTFAETNKSKARWPSVAPSKSDPPRPPRRSERARKLRGGGGALLSHL